MTPVRFQLRLPGAARADPAAEFGKGGAFSFQPRLKVFQLREFDLQFTFTALRALGENI